MTDEDATSVLATLNRHGRNARDALDEFGCAARDHFGRILSTALLTGGGLWLLWSTRPVTAALVEEARHLTPEGQVNALLMVLSIWWVWRRLRSSVRLRVQASAVAVAVPAASGISHRGGAAKTPDETLERRARHEAAHVVVGRHLGAILYRSDLTVRDGDGSGGRTVMHWPEGLPPQDEMWNDAVMSLSGNEVDIAGGFHDVGSTQDIVSAHRAVAAIISTRHSPAEYEGRLTFDELLSVAGATAATILRERSADLDDVADALQRSHSRGGYISEADLE